MNGPDATTPARRRGDPAPALCAAGARGVRGRRRGAVRPQRPGHRASVRRAPCCASSTPPPRRTSRHGCRPRCGSSRLDARAWRCRRRPSGRGRRRTLARARRVLPAAGDRRDGTGAERLRPGDRLVEPATGFAQHRRGSQPPPGRRCTARVAAWPWPWLQRPPTTCGRACWSQAQCSPAALGLEVVSRIVATRYLSPFEELGEMLGLAVLLTALLPYVRGVVARLRPAARSRSRWDRPRARNEEAPRTNGVDTARGTRVGHSLHRCHLGPEMAS